MSKQSQVVVVTGALAGIGRATVLAFARDGARIVIAGRRQDVGLKLAQELRSLGSEVEFVQTDVRLETEVQALIDKTVKRFGRLDVAVNCAGTEGKNGPLTEMTLENYNETLDTNLLGTFLCMKYELRVMQPQGSGSIINLSSTLGRKAAPGASLYAASKHGVEGLTKTAALEAAPFQVRVNAVAPGPIDTEMLTRFTATPDKKKALISAVPLKRMGRPEEVAETILFLASDKAPFITGQIFGVDGGKMA